MEWCEKEVRTILAEVTTSLQGLSGVEAHARLQKYGKNGIQRVTSISLLRIILGQIKNFINYVMICAVVLSFFIGNSVDAGVILGILVLNIILGVVQDFKAEHAMQALVNLAAPRAVVVREGKKQEIAAADVAPGDVLVLEEGTVIAADARLVEVAELRVDESILTGESVPVEKNMQKLTHAVPVADQANMVFASTTIVGGRGLGVVVATGLRTELGKIAHDVQQVVEEETPLQVQLKRLGIIITIMILIIAGVVFSLDVLRTGAWEGALLIAIALAVAAIPEGLPAVITITLAFGTHRMLRKKVLVRRLNAVETLGSTSVICADKTGTITKNQMEVVALFVNHKMVGVQGSAFMMNGMIVRTVKGMESLLEVGVCCNNASLDGISDPTEKALLVLARNVGYHQDHARMKEIPFSSDRKCMVTVDKMNGKVVGHIKGAPEVVLGKCTHVLVQGKVKRLLRADRERIMDANKEMASKALRVLGCAVYSNRKEKEVVFVGLIGMIDPPREGVKEAVAECQNAGIRVVMMTGDHAVTAYAIAKQVGITGRVMLGEEVEKMRAGALGSIAHEIGVYARVSPHQKLKILSALQAQGDVVAMTGDGVNDALALKKADIGIAPGSGSDVAKEASDMVLLDDHFASIVEAVREGRGIYANLKKFVSYLFSSNLAEVLIILIALVFALPLPLLAVQILWVNLLTDGFPALALGTDPTSRLVMGRKLRRKDAPFFYWREVMAMIGQAVIIAGGVLILFFWYVREGRGVEVARTVAFSVLVIFELFNAWNYHMVDRSWGREMFANKWLLLALGSSVILQGVVVYWLNAFFGTVALGIVDWVWIVCVGSSVLIVQQGIKKIVSISS